MTTCINSNPLEKRMNDKTPMYEGKNTDLLEEPRCLYCIETPSATKLLRCSRCHVAWYCTTNCQKAHYAGKHRAVCQNIAKHLKTIQQHGLLLRMATTQSVFETDTGAFGICHKRKRTWKPRMM